MNFSVPTRQTADRSIKDKIDEGAAKWVADNAAHGLAFTATPYGLQAHKLGERPKLTMQQVRKGRLTGKLTP